MGLKPVKMNDTKVLLKIAQAHGIPDADARFLINFFRTICDGEKRMKKRRCTCMDAYEK